MLSSLRTLRLSTPPYSSNSSDTSYSADSNENLKSVTEEVRSLSQCIEIFDNGPRPVSESLALLNDEEVIMLAQCGKIAAYSLEKVLGMNELERAVRIRRALICECVPFNFDSLVISLFCDCWISSCFVDTDTRSI